MTHYREPDGRTRILYAIDPDGTVWWCRRIGATLHRCTIQHWQRVSKRWRVTRGEVS